MRLVSNLRRHASQHVVDQDHFQADEVQSGYLNRPDKEEPVDHRDEGVRKQNEIGPRDCRHRPAGPERRGR